MTYRLVSWPEGLDKAHAAPATNDCEHEVGEPSPLFVTTLERMP